jgi:hypothetical protein
LTRAEFASQLSHQMATRGRRQGNFNNGVSGQFKRT